MDMTIDDIKALIAADVEIHYVDVPDRPGNKVIAMHFDGWVWGERPHTFHGCPYYKVESTTKVMPHDMYDERIRAHQPQMYAWESQIANDVSLADLNEKHIRGCIRLGVEGGRIPASAMIAEALYKSTYLESWGSGAKRIMDACREQGVEEPSWRWDGGFVIVTFKRPNKESLSSEVSLEQDANTTPVPRPRRTSSVPVPYQFHTSSDLDRKRD